MRIFTIVPCIIGMLYLFAGTARSQASLVKDINQGLIAAQHSEPQNFIEIDGITYFTANSEGIGTELWKSDGTEEGTVLVKDIYPGIFSSNPNTLTEFNGMLFFRVDDGTNGAELWKSDGTEAGTVMVKDIYPGSGSSGPNSLTEMNGLLFFSANDGTNGLELWKSDGTATGTMMVKNISPGSGGSGPQYLTEMNGLLFFSVYNSTNGAELWKSDGTSAGTVVVKNIASGISALSIGFLTEVNGILFFSAGDDTNGRELWKSDGTAVGTVMVKDINPGSGSSGPNSLTEMNGILFFSANDGTNGDELWKSDGTAAGTLMVKDIYPGSGGRAPNFLTEVNGMLFFSADDGTNGSELWKSDGTAAGTVMVKNIYPGNSPSYPEFLTEVNGTLFFVADDGTNGVELWKSDGTAAGTVMVKNIYPENEDSIFYSDPSNLTEVNGTLYFGANDGTHGRELWKSDGTETGTVLVKNIYLEVRGSGPEFLVEMNGTLFFRANDGTNGAELWKSNGTETGTMLVADIVPGSDGSYPTYITKVNSTLFFRANDGTHGTELWKSDGTAAGTVLVKDIKPKGPNWVGNSNPHSLTEVNGMLFFVANSGIYNSDDGKELWKSDGTEAGTVLVKDIYSWSGGGYAEYLTEMNDILFFVADVNGIYGAELWKSDGTEAGTVLVKDIYPGDNPSGPASLTEVNGTLFFRANDGTNGYELWKSDGTEAGTVLVKDINSGSGGSSPKYLTEMNGTLFFVADDGSNGLQLWKSDGTADGTVPVDEVNNKEISASITNLFAVDNILYFSASSGPEGLELWRTDGTAEGTFLAADIYPGAGSSNPSGFENIGETLYFSANDGIHSSELWKYGLQEEAMKFTLVNAATNKDIIELTEGMQLNINELPNVPFSIRVDTYTSGVGSIAMNLSGAKTVNHTENLVPYTLFGDGDGNYTGEKLPVGDYTFSSTIYSGTNGSGTQAETTTLNFSIVGDAMTYTLVNATTNTDITKLSEGMELNVNELPKAPLSIRIDAYTSGVGSVKMTLSGSKTINHIENSVPYALFGDDGNGDYSGEYFEMGNYSISGTIYSGSNGIGTQGASESINFSIIGEALSFTLVNANTDTDIIQLSEGMELNVSELPNVPMSIRVNSYVLDVGSIKMSLSGEKNVNATENTLPYALFGDDNGDYAGEWFDPGDYTISGTVYNDRNGTGTQGEEVSINFSIIGDPLSFTLVNANTDTDFIQLSEGMQLSSNDLTKYGLSIRADIYNPTGVGSVMMSLSGAKNVNRTENLIPYALFGDDEHGDYFGEHFVMGDYTISGTIYSGRNGTGTQGSEVSINFSIVNSQATLRTANNDKTRFGKEEVLTTELPQKLSVYPNPFTNAFNLDVTNFSHEKIEIQLIDMYGKLLIEKNVETTSGEVDIHTEGEVIANGTYLLKVIWKDQVEIVKVIRQDQ